jgi:hypothetical protein
MDKCLRSLTSIVADNQQTKHGKYHSKQMSKCLDLHYNKGHELNEQMRRTTTKRHFVESASSSERTPAKKARKSPELGDSEMGETLLQLVREIKEMKVQLGKISADMPLQGVVGLTSADRGCKLCRGDAEREREVETNWSDEDGSQEPGLYY